MPKDWEEVYVRGKTPRALADFIERGLKGPNVLRRRVLSPLREVFKKRCCYCTAGETERSQATFEVEHRKPVRLFDNFTQASTWENLYYACHRCNRAKGSQYPQSTMPTQGLVDPCVEPLYPRYLEFHKTGIRGVRDPGPYMAEVLHFSSRKDLRHLVAQRLYLRQAWEAVDRGDSAEAVRRLQDLLMLLKDQSLSPVVGELSQELLSHLAMVIRD